MNDFLNALNAFLNSTLGVTLIALVGAIMTALAAFRSVIHKIDANRADRLSDARSQGDALQVEIAARADFIDLASQVLIKVPEVAKTPKERLDFVQVNLCGQSSMDQVKRIERFIDRAFERLPSIATEQRVGLADCLRHIEHFNENMYRLADRLAAAAKSPDTDASEMIASYAETIKANKDLVLRYLSDVKRLPENLATNWERQGDGSAGTRGE
jgi:hypothetical protein